jgi:CHAT domain-containing protein
VITLASTTGEINTSKGILDSSSSFGNGGAIALSAGGNLTTAQINSSSGSSGNGGAIALTSNNGAINTTAGSINSSSSSGNGGAIALSAPGNIISSNIISKSGNQVGGDITLNSRAGVVESGNLDASGNTSGGKITLIARDQITAGQINSSARLGNGGDVTLDPIGDIQVDFINAQGGRQGTGGTVDIATQRFFRANSSFLDQNGITASISTAGGTGGRSASAQSRRGSITIQHGGGSVTPFLVAGDVTDNGTVGNITTGLGQDDTLRPGTYFDLVTQGKIQLITAGSDINPLSNDIQGETPGGTRLSEPIDSISTTAGISLNTIDVLYNNLSEALSTGNLEVAMPLIEELRDQEYENYLGTSSPEITGESVVAQGTNSQKPSVSLEQTQSKLSNIASQTGKTPAIIYAFAQPEQLDLILVTPNGQPILRTIRETNRATLLKKVIEFRSEVTEPRKKTSYLASAQKLYQWLIAPLEAELKARKIDTLAFSLDPGLRSLPLAALHDGQQFLVENYSIGLIPSINLVDTRYQDIKNFKVLAMGASKFTDQSPLPAVPIELSTIVGNQMVGAQNRELLSSGQSSPSTEGLWSGKSFLNEGFTLANLKSQRTKEPFGIIHLATHGEFKAGTPNNSYIQLWDTRLPLNQLRQLGWNNPPVELLVLSACRTAVGDEQAELGFGGLAVAAGVKSAVASLWYVSDEGTLGLMSEFYQQLKSAPIKAEALRQAQIAMIKGQVKIEGGKLRSPGERGGVPLPPELAQAGDKNLSHPNYWAAFTMIGSPW